MLFEWDDVKEKINIAKHGIRRISARKATTQEGRMYYDYTQGK